MIISIAGKQREILDGSLNIDDAIGERSTASFIVRDLAGNLTFKKGQPVYINNDFGGVIDTPKMQVVTPKGAKFHTIKCADWHYLADKRIIAYAYQNMLAGDIVRHIVTNYLAAEGVKIGEDTGHYFLSSDFPADFVEGDTPTVEDGPTVKEAIFNYVPISQALDALAEKAGFWWYIDHTKTLHFRARTSVTAPFDIDASVIIGEPTLEHGNPHYRNKQYIRGGTDVTDPLTETKVGDGETRSFTMGFKLAKVPTIEVSLDGEPFTTIPSGDVGIKGVDTGKKWYWSKGDAVVMQEYTEPVLGSTDKVRITYQGMFPIIAITMDNDAIVNRQNVEGGGTGLVEDVDDEPQSTNREAAFEIANKKLEKYAVIGRRLKFRTRRSGLRPGQLATVDLPDYGLNNAEMLIESVNISDEGPVTWYDITAAEGPEQGSWTRLFAAMATRGQTFIIRENISEDEILVTLATFTKTWQQAESPNIFHVLRPGAGTRPGVGVKPMFAMQDRVKQLAWFDAGGVEQGRKTITKQVGEETDEIISTTYLAPWEANIDIAELAWYGGINSNIEVDRQAYVKTKTDLESIQVDKTDTKGW